MTNTKSKKIVVKGNKKQTPAPHPCTAIFS